MTAVTTTTVKSPTTELDFRTGTPADTASIVELLRASLGEGTIPRSQEYWLWKHVNNPFGASAVLVAEANGALVGLRAFLRWNWQIGGETICTVRAVDTATHPDYRGRGIFKRLTLQLRDEMAAEGVRFVYNTPNAQSRPGYLKMGWSLVGKPTLWIRPVHPVRLAKAMRSRGLSGKEQTPPLVDAKPVDEILDDSGVQALLEDVQTAADDRFHTRVDLGYLRWRYQQIPGFAYYAVSQGEGADGALVIFRTRCRGAVREMRLCELVVGTSALASQHLRSLLRQMPKLADVDVIIAMAAGRGELKRALLKSLYLPVPKAGPILTAYDLAEEQGGVSPLSLANWGASIGDLELF